MKIETAGINSSDKHVIYIVAAIVVLTLLTVSYYSGLYGFVSPDSWEYLRLATSLSNGDACTVYGEYFAVFPCGYPITISAFSYLSGIDDLLIASKLTNLIFILLTFFIVYIGSKNIYAATVFVCNPLTINIFHYTWSENLFLLSTVSVMVSIFVIYKKGYTHRYGALLLFSLIVGCSSRYFFAPFALLIFISAHLIYGYKTSRKVFLHFVAAGILFIGYYYFNYKLTGSGTGMPRIPAPETIKLLLLYFSNAVLRETILIIFCSAPIVFFVLRKLHKNKIKISRCISIAENPFSYFMLLVGISYLGLSFLMRTTAQFDLYGTRTVGYGIVLLASAIIAMISSKIKLDKMAIIAVILSCSLSVLLSQRDFYLGHLFPKKDSILPTYTQAIQEYRSTIKAPGTIVSVNIPDPSIYIRSNKDIYYPASANVILTKTAPYSKPDSLQDLRGRFLKNGEAACFFDFTNIKNEAELIKIIDSTHPVDFSFNTASLRPYLISKKRFSTDLRKKVKSIFEPGKAVPCGL